MKDRFVTIAVFQYSSEALIIKGKLESEGVKVFLVDEYTVDTDPLVSNAIGGVKLQVYTDQLEHAKEIVKKTSPELLKEENLCPSCKSPNVTFKISFSNILKRLFPVTDSFQYKCSDCGMVYNDKEY